MIDDTSYTASADTATVLFLIGKVENCWLMVWMMALSIKNEIENECYIYTALCSGAMLGIQLTLGICGGSIPEPPADADFHE